MTKTEWLACTDPTPMLEFLRGKVSDRKLRLFACACCRRVWPSLTDERSRRAVEVSESYADGAATWDELRATWADAAGVVEESSLAQAAMRVAEDEPEKAVWVIGRAFLNSRANKEERKGQAFLARDIFGDPFRPVAVESSWLAWDGGTIPKLAQAIYDDRAFDRLPILADALEEAGCTNADILAHCHSEGPHVRGCWVIDLLLGKQ